MTTDNWTYEICVEQVEDDVFVATCERLDLMVRSDSFEAAIEALSRLIAERLGAAEAAPA